MEIWDRTERVTLVRPGQAEPSTLTLRRVARSMKMRLWTLVPAALVGTPQGHEHFIGLVVRSAIAGWMGLTDAETGEKIADGPDPNARGLTGLVEKNGNGMCPAEVFDALSDLDMAMVAGVAVSLLPPAKVRSIAESKLAECKALHEAIAEINAEVAAKDTEAAERMRGN